MHAFSWWSSSSGVSNVCDVSIVEMTSNVSLHDCGATNTI
jgi:hypothetical protein